MNALKAQLLRIQQQLGELSASQKMLVASLVAIMLITVFWWTHYAGSAETVSLLGDQNTAAADVGHIKDKLDMYGIDAQVVGDRVMVPTDRRLEALARLTYDDALPSAGANPWEDMFKQMGPFDPKSKTDAMQNHAKEMLVALVIKTFPGVANATVMIDPTNERRVTAPLEPKASISIITRGHDAVVKRLADAASSAVSFAVAGLQRKNVSIIINGMLQRSQDQNDSVVEGELYEQTKALEDQKTDTILRLMPQGTIAAVTVNIDTNSSQENVESFDKSKSLSLPLSSKTKDDETQAAAAQATEPGAVPNSANTGLSIGGSQGAGGGGTNTSTQAEDSFQNYPGRTVAQISKPAGQASVASAAVSLPRSYYVNKYMRANPNAKEPDENGVQALFNQDMPSRRDMIVKGIALKSPDDLALTMYDDGGSPLLAAAGADSTASPSNMTAMLGGHAKEVAVGALAVISLFMVSMIVKKGTPVPIPAPVAQVNEAPTLGSDEALAGIVGGESGTMLDGIELGEDAVKAQHVVEQVATMVKENPDAAANLVKRWLNRS